jgi:uncharacterized membrane protein YkoI
MKRCLLIAALLLGAVAPAAAQTYPQRGEQPGAASAGRLMPLSKIIPEIAKRTPGKLLNASLGDSGGRQVYFVQWQLANGRVKVLVIDAESGREIG